MERVLCYSAHIGHNCHTTPLEARKQGIAMVGAQGFIEVMEENYRIRPLGWFGWCMCDTVGALCCIAAIIYA